MIIEILDIGYPYKAININNKWEIVGQKCEPLKLKIRYIDIARGNENDSIYHVVGYSIPINLYPTERPHVALLINKAESLKMNIIQILGTASGLRVRYMLHDNILLPMHIQNKNNAEYVEGHEKEGAKELLKLYKSISSPLSCLYPE